MANINTKQVPTRWDMTLYRGSKWPAWNFNLVDDASAPLAGFTVLMQIKRSPFSETSEKELAGGDGFIVVSNNVKFNTDVDLGFGEYVHDIQVTLSNGESYTQYAGKITVTQDVSRVVI